MPKKPTYSDLEHRVEKLEKQVLERKHAEKALREVEEYYRIIMDAAPDSITITRMEDGCYLEVNEAFCQLSGYSREQALGRTPFELNLFVNPSDRERFIKTLREKGAVADFDIQYRVREGTIHDTILSAKPVKYRGQDCLISIVTVISERKRAEEALRESESKYRLLVQNMTDLIVKVDTARNLLYVSPSYCEMFGKTEEELIEKEFMPLIHEDDRARISASLRKTLRPPYTTFHEERAFTKTGERWLAWSAKGVPNESDIVEEIIAVGRDVTERKRAEEALLQSEERYRSLVENTMDGYFICEIPSGKFLFLNQRCCDLFGYTMKEGLKLAVWNVMAPEDHDRIRQRIQARLEGKLLSSERQTYNAIRKDGSTFRVEISTSLVSFQDNPAVQGVIRDITEQERLERQLHQAQKIESIGTLAGGIAHDFNNLLMGIQGNASLILLDVDPRHPFYEKLKSIEQYVQSGSELTKQLLGFARGGKYEVRATDLNDLINESARMFGRARKEIRIHIKLQEGLWATEVDRGQIEQVLLNLYVNAWQAMPGGGDLFLQTENVVVKEDSAEPFNVRPGRFVKISVTDTGIGMDEDTQNRVFDPFFTTKEMGRGTGLGLASAYGIVKNHDGIIDVYSEKGEGTTFNIYLPSSEKEIVLRQDNGQKILKGNETVFLVDDENMILEVGKQLLERLGYEVILARGGNEALEVYVENRDRIDLVILDMVMPDMGGGDTYDRLKQIDPTIRVLLASGYSINGKAKAILDRGCDAFIQKPFNLKELSRKVRAVLDKKKP